MRYLFLITISFLPHLLQAQSSNQGHLASYTFKAEYMDRYIFRGHVLNDNPTMLGQFKFGVGKFSYDLVYTQPQDKKDTSWNEEFNHSVKFTMIQGRRVTDFGYRVYEYDGLIPDTQEIFTRVTHLTKWNPTYGLSVDFDTYKGYYLDYSISRKTPLSRTFLMEYGIRGGIAYELEEKENDEGKITEPGFFNDDGFTSALADLSLKWAPAPWLNMETGFQYHYSFDNRLFNDVIDRENTVWKTSVTIRFP